MEKVFEALSQNLIFVVMLFVPISIVGITSYFGHKRTEMVHRERMAAIEKGILPPGELTDPEEKQRDEEKQEAPNLLRRGLFWICPGAGTVAFSLFMKDMPPAVRLPILGVAVVCVGIGAAYLVIYLVEDERARGGVDVLRH